MSFNELYEKDTFIRLFQDGTYKEYEYNFDEQLIDSISKLNFNVNFGRLMDGITEVLNEGNVDHMQRAFIVCLCLYTKISSNEYQEIICDFLTHDKWQVGDEEEEDNENGEVLQKLTFGHDSGSSIIFNDHFFEELKKSRKCMMVASRIFKEFFERHGFAHDETFRIPYKIVCFNEIIEHQLPYDDVCPIPEEQFKKHINNKNTKIESIDVEKAFPLMVPFSMKKEKFNSIRNNSINVQIHLGPDQLAEIKNLYNLVKSNQQIGIEIINNSYKIGNQCPDLIWFFINNTDCMRKVGQFYWFNTNLKKDGENARNLATLGLLISACLSNKIQTRVKFPLALYKKLLNRPLSFFDFCDVDLKSYNFVKNIYEDCKNYGKDDGMYDFSFPVSDTFWVNLSSPNYNQLTENDVVEPLIEENRNEFLYRVANYFMNHRVSWYFEQLIKGFQTVPLPDYVNNNFRLQEYGMLLSSSDNIEEILKTCPPGYRMCPNCHLICLKDERCNYVECSQCGTDFDYYTGFKGGKHSFNHPPDFRKYILHENVSDQELNEFYEKFPHLKPA